ncbi:MAG TPA: hypothetical protein VLF63_03425 [Patescibacteria group bacterium]|nr:hypothetical protein [Patescibacteria group bacterium]
MDYSNRSTHQVPVSGQSEAPNAAARRSHKGKSDKNMWSRVGIVAIVVAVAILLVGMILLLFANNPNKNSESKFVFTNKLQAVFLNTGQVYFGNITNLNNRYTTLTNIYYLQTTNSSGSAAAANSSSNNVTLVKLGCELHMPYDQMVINNNQVTFWENLQDNGQVAKAVATFQKQNPNGQKCADQSTSSTNTSNAVQSSTPSTTTSGSSTSR